MKPREFEESNGITRHLHQNIFVLGHFLSSISLILSVEAMNRRGSEAGKRVGKERKMSILSSLITPKVLTPTVLAKEMRRYYSSWTSWTAYQGGRS